MRNVLFTCSLALFVPKAFGQSLQQKKMMDSIKSVHMNQYAWKNPVLRQAGFSTEIFAAGTIKSNLYGKAFFEGKLRMIRNNFYFNVPISQSAKNIFSASFAGSYQSGRIYHVTNYEPSLPVGSMNTYNSTLRTTVSYTRLGSLFHRSAIYSLIASGLINPETGQLRIFFTGMVSLTVVKTKSSVLSVGILGLVDPSSPLPVLPFISYYHQFKSTGLELFLDPYKMALKKGLGAKRSIMLSNEIGGNIALFKQDATALPLNNVFTSLEMRLGLTYEQLITKKVVLTISSGVNNTLNSKVMDQSGDKNTFIENRQSMVPYLKVGVSLLPFWKGVFR